MIFPFLLVLLLAIIGLKFTHFNHDYLSKRQTTAINGAFVLLVFLRHFNQYIELDDSFFDKSFGLINSWLGQLIVVSFLFYSGFGLINGILNKEGYMKRFWLHRFVPVWLSFAICLCFFILTAFIKGGGVIKYDLSQILLSFTGWTSVGNSNWYMFVTFALYVSIFFAFAFIPRNKVIISLSVFSLVSIGLAVFLYFFKPSSWWNTLLCLPFGMWYGLLKNKIDKVMEKTRNYWIVTVAVFILFAAVWFVFYKTGNDLLFIPVALLFALLIVFISMKIVLGNAVIAFLGGACI